MEDNGPDSSLQDLGGHIMDNDGSAPDTSHEEIPPQNLETHTDLGYSAKEGPDATQTPE